MYTKFNSPSYKCLFLTKTIFVVVLINQVQSRQNRYILPVLPETRYTLNDVIILPENTDIVEITIKNLNKSTELTTWNLTVEHDFRLGHVFGVQNVSVESGLQLITSCKTTVLIDLPGGLLQLPQLADSGLLHYIFTLPENSEKIFDKPLVVQSEVPDTLIRLCVITDNKNNETSDNFEPNLEERNNTDKCSNLTTSAIGRYLLNVTSEFYGINNLSGLMGVVITSEHPIIILHGQDKQLPGRNKHENNTVNLQHSQISWNVIPALSNKSSTYVVIPSIQKRHYTFYVACSVDGRVDFQTDADLKTINVTANEPINASFTISPDAILTVTMEHGFSLDCVKLDHSTCNNELLPVNYGSMFYNNSDNNYSNILDIGKKHALYRWISMSNYSNLFILIPSDTDFKVTSLNGNISSVSEVHFKIRYTSFKLISLVHSSVGLYKISSNSTVDTCLLHYLSKKKDTYSNDNFSQNTTNEPGTTISSALSNTRTGMIANIESFTSNMSSTNLPNNYSVDKAEQTMPHFSMIEQTTMVKSASFLPLEDNIDATSLEISTAPGTDNSHTSHQDTQVTQAASGLPERDRQDNVITNKSISSKTFKAVVDIFHSKEGRKDILIDNSKTQEDPKYTYKYNVNNNIGQVGDGKNPVAIIASLVSAILAVGAIILIFLLKDFFSRRQHIRKTRIRPFISYY